MTSLDLSRLPPPHAIELLDFEALFTRFQERFQSAWDAERTENPSLPSYDVGGLETDPVVIVAQAWSYLRLLDRARVNDAVKAVLAPLATGSDLDNVVARMGIQRLVISPATQNSAAVLESDLALLRRYMLAFERPSAGSRDRYLLEAWTAWPAMLDARVNGHAVHGRRGDTDVVIIGPAGRLPSPEERAVVSAAVRAPNVQPEAVNVAVLNAVRREYSVELVVEVPPGPDAALVRDEAARRVTAAAEARMLISGEIPAGYLSGAAYGPSIIRVRDVSPVVIEADPYTVPVMNGLTIAIEARS